MKVKKIVGKLIYHIVTFSLLFVIVVAVFSLPTIPIYYVCNWLAKLIERLSEITLLEAWAISISACVSFIFISSFLFWLYLNLGISDLSKGEKHE